MNMKNILIICLLQISSIISAQIPKGEIWTLSVDSLTIVRDGQPGTTLINPEISISFKTDDNLLEIWESNYSITYHYFEPDTIFESAKNEKLYCLTWWADGKVNPSSVSPSLRKIPDCKIGFKNYLEDKKLKITIIRKNQMKSLFYFAKIEKIKPSTPPARSFKL